MRKSAKEIVSPSNTAGLRNVGFQDMEDLARTLERMRRDVIEYGG